MSHRIVSAVTAFVLALCGGAALLFALGATPEIPRARAPGGRPVPHETAGSHAPCRDCHASGEAPRMPATHRTFEAGHCLGCHRPGA